MVTVTSLSISQVAYSNLMYLYRFALITRAARANHARAPGQIGERGPHVPLDSHADGHIKVY